MRLLISNLNRLTTSSHLVALLLPFGLVTSVRIIMDNRNGCSEGAALVEMEYRGGQVVINQLNDMRFMNYFICVEETASR